MTETETIIRQALRDDVVALAAFIETFVTDRRILPRTVDELAELVAHGFIAEKAGRIVGFAALEVYSTKLGEVRSLAVAAEMQGHGIGRKLLAACIERAHSLNVLEVLAITSEEAFFRSCGFDFTLPGEKKAMFIQTRELP
jgi:N-acetylglutamate synthase-like GNAT family acetyltransferase